MAAARRLPFLQSLGLHKVCRKLGPEALLIRDRRSLSGLSSTARQRGPRARIVCRFLDADGNERLGQPLDSPYNEMLEVTDPFETKEGATEAKLILEPPLKMAKMLSPVDNAPDIICCGLNYKQHAKEVGLDIPKLPTLFSKSRNTLQNPYDPIELPSCAENENIPKEEAMDYVFGYTVANDITARRWQMYQRSLRWHHRFSNIGKSFDTFLPLGPSITAAWSLDPSDLRIVTEVNGQIVQESSTKDMIFDVPTLINFCSMDTTLMPGTIILTGTPAGVGYVRDPPLYLKAGDRVSVQIEGIGKLINPVVGPVTDAAT